MGDELTGAGNLLIGIAMVGQLIVSLYGLLMARKNAGNIEHLEKNTNSIKDALVRVTGEAERAKGVLEGTERAKVAMEDKLAARPEK